MKNILLVAVLLLTALVTGNARAASNRYATSVATHTPLAHWRFNDAAFSGTFVADSSPNARHGTHQPVFSQFAMQSMVTVGDRGVRSLGGTAYIQVSHHAALNPSALTIEAIVKLPATFGTIQRIVEKSTTSGATQAQYGLGLDADGRLRFAFTTAGAQAVVTDSPLSVGNNYHLAATYDGTNARIYVNGVNVKTTAIAGTLATASTQHIAIANILTGTAPFVGYIDEIAIFGSALSGANIQAHMDAVAQRAPLTIDTPRPDNAGLMTGAPTLTFAEVGATGDTITRGAGDWRLEGFHANDLVTVSGTASNNFVAGRVTSVTQFVLTLDTQDLAAEVTAAATVKSVFSSFLTTTFPVQAGVPIPEEDLYSATPVRLIDAVGVEVSSQFKVLGRWRKFGNGVYPSDSAIPVSWLQVTFHAPVSLASSAVFYVEYGPWTANTSSGSMATAVANDYDINTGPTGVRFKVLRDFPTLLDQVWIDIDNDGTIETGSEQVVGPSAVPHGLYFTDQDNNVYRAGFDTTGATLVLEEDGPQQVTLKATGHYRLSGVTNADDNAWTVRIKAYRNKPFVRVFVTMTVNKASPARRYKDIGVELRHPSTTTNNVYFARGTNYTVPHSFLPDQRETVEYGTWITPNVVTAPHHLQFRVARPELVRLYRDNTNISGGPVSRTRFGHWMNFSGTATGGAFNLTSTLRWAWQQYPNGMAWFEDGADQLTRTHLWSRFPTSADASQDKQLSFHPLQWLRGRGLATVPEGGAGAIPIFSSQAFSGSCPLDNYQYPADDPAYSFDSGVCDNGCIQATGVGVAKTWEIMYDFQRTALVTGTPSSQPETAFFTQRPVLAVVDPAWLADSLVMGKIAAQDPVLFPEIDARPACTTDADCSNGRKCRPTGTCQNAADVYLDRVKLEQISNGEETGTYGPAYPMDVPGDGADKRPWGDSLGAMDFGDLMQNGRRAHRFYMHTRYFVGSVHWLWYARSGDRRMYEFGEQNSRHIMDLDINHTAYEFSWTCEAPNNFNGTYRMPRGIQRDGDIGVHHWSSSRPNNYDCILLPGGGCDNSQVRVAVIAAPADYASFLIKYYYLTGYERAKDVAEEISGAISENVARPGEGYWQQNESRTLGGGAMNASDLFGLLGHPDLETAAKKMMAKMVGLGTGISNSEIASNRVCPRHPSPGVAFSFGTPYDNASSYMGPGAVAYMQRATAATVPSRAAVSRWLQDQALGLDDMSKRLWPNTDTNVWPTVAAAYHELTDTNAKARALRPALAELEQFKSGGYSEVQQSFTRSLAFHGLPYLLSAVKDSKAYVPAEPEAIPVTSGAELQYKKLVPEDVEITVRAMEVFHHSALPFFAQSLVIPALPAATSGIPYLLAAGVQPTDSGPRICTNNNCSAAVVLYGPDGTALDSRGYPPGYTITPPRCVQRSDLPRYSRGWYNVGGWFERLTLRGPPGIYRARIEVDGIVTGTRVESGANTTAINDYNKPLFTLVAVRNDPSKAQVMGYAGHNDGISPGERFDKILPRYAYVPSGAVPVTFTFDYQETAGVFPFAAFLPGGGAATVSGGGDNVAWTVTVPGGDRNARWRFDLGPEYTTWPFGYDNTATCTDVSTPLACKTATKWTVETRPFTVTGIYPWFANNTVNYFVPQPLSPPVLVSPTGLNDNGTPPTTLRWRAVPFADNYRVTWTDGNYCGAWTSEVVTPAAAHCAYGVGQCWLARTITGGRGQWAVQSQNALVDSGSWPWSRTMEFRYGKILPAPAIPELHTLAGQTFRWSPVTGASHYTVETDDSSNGPRAYTTVTEAAAGCPSDSGTCQTTVATVFASGPASWRVQANCSGNLSPGRSFVVP